MDWRSRPRSVGFVIATAWLAAGFHVSHAAADVAEHSMPFGDSPVATDAEGRALLVAAAGLSDGRGRTEGQVLRARAVAERRARDALTTYLDRVLAAGAASPATATRLHAAATAALEFVGERRLADGSVVVQLRLPLASLERAWPKGAARWNP